MSYRRKETFEAWQFLGAFHDFAGIQRLLKDNIVITVQSRSLGDAGQGVDVFLPACATDTYGGLLEPRDWVVSSNEKRNDVQIIADGEFRDCFEEVL